MIVSTRVENWPYLARVRPMACFLSQGECGTLLLFIINTVLCMSCIYEKRVYSSIDSRVWWASFYVDTPQLGGRWLPSGAMSDSDVHREESSVLFRSCCEGLRGCNCSRNEMSSLYVNGGLEVELWARFGVAGSMVHLEARCTVLLMCCTTRVRGGVFFLFFRSCCFCLADGFVFLVEAYCGKISYY